MAKKKREGWQDKQSETFHNPFAALQEKKKDLPSVPLANSSPTTSISSDKPKVPQKAIVSLERKGRRGKTVTLVKELGLPKDILTDWCSLLRNTLGCGGTLEGEVLVLQGDHRERITQWLVQKGVKKVVS